MGLGIMLTMVRKTKNNKLQNDWKFGHQTAFGVDECTQCFGFDEI